jgi:hypothetical protein
MKLTARQAYELLDKHGSYITEICDRCGQGIGPVRFTRKDDSGVWCSRECRGDLHGDAIRKGGRPRKYRTEDARTDAERQQNAERQRAFRAGVQRNGKPPRTVAETKDLQAQKSPLSTIPLTHHLRPTVGLP